MTFPLKISFNGQLIPYAIVHSGRKTTFHYPCESSDQCQPYEVTFKKGLCKIECWGAGREHPEEEDRHGYGAYTRGTIYFPASQKLYLYLGATLGRFNAIHPDPP